MPGAPLSGSITTHLVGAVFTVNREFGVSLHRRPFAKRLGPSFRVLPTHQRLARLGEMGSLELRQRLLRSIQNDWKPPLIFGASVLVLLPSLQISFWLIELGFEKSSITLGLIILVVATIPWAVYKLVRSARGGLGPALWNGFFMKTAFFGWFFGLLFLVRAL